jgi:hypothetical protein
MSDTANVTSEEILPFPSLASLRAAHSELLRRHRNDGDKSEFFAEVERFLRRAQATGALLDGEKERWESQSVLDYWTTLSTRAGRPTLEVELDPFDPELAPELDESQCPYLGLNAFLENNHEQFFGRERLVEEIIERLRSPSQGLLVVTGPSGSGKSSLVFAGLLPTLQAGKLLPGSDRWRYHRHIVPGSDPLTNLARAVKALEPFTEVVCEDISDPLFNVKWAAKPPGQYSPPAESADWMARQAAGFLRDPGHLVELLKELGHGPVVLVVDQFEEIFTLCPDEEARQAFVNNLVRVAQSHEQGHKVILTLRSDFESHIARLPALQALFEDVRVRVTPTPLSARDLRRAIEEPARRVGLRFEEGLVEELVKEVLGEPAALPLLQFTLLKLWQKRSRNRVTRQAFRDLGGARLALARTADAFYNDLLPEEQVLVRQIFLRLVLPGDGLEIVRNRVRRASLIQAIGGGVARVVDKLVLASLLRLSPGETRTDDQVEVVHEALVRNWPKLVEWLEQAREELRQRSRLTADAKLWSARNRDPSLLLRGTRLEEAERYHDLEPLEKELVDKSRQAFEKEREEKEAASRRELEQARALARAQEKRAEAQKRFNRRLLLLTGVLVIFVFIAIGLAATAWKQGREAEGLRREADKQRSEAELERSAAEESRNEASDERDKAKLGLTDLISEKLRDLYKGNYDAGVKLWLVIEALRFRRPGKSLDQVALEKLDPEECWIWRPRCPHSCRPHSLPTSRPRLGSWRLTSTGGSSLQAARMELRCSGIVNRALHSSTDFRMQTERQSLPSRSV